MKNVKMQIIKLFCENDELFISDCFINIYLVFY